MYTYISFLRGINVGGRIIKMVDLKRCYEEANFSGVTTILQSGNVIFKSKNPSVESVCNKLESVVSAEFNYSAKIIVLTLDELNKVVSNYPFDSQDQSYQHYIVFFKGVNPTDILDAAQLVSSKDDKLEFIFNAK